MFKIRALSGGTQRGAGERRRRRIHALVQPKIRPATSPFVMRVTAEIRARKEVGNGCEIPHADPFRARGARHDGAKAARNALRGVGSWGCRSSWDVIVRGCGPPR